MQDILIRNIKILKADKSLTNNDLSEIMGVSVAVIKNYLRGKTPVPLNHIQAFSSSTGIDIDWLLHGGTVQLNSKIFDDTIKVAPKELALKLTGEAFELIFDELQMLRDNIAKLEEKVNNLEHQSSHF